MDMQEIGNREFNTDINEGDMTHVERWRIVALFAIICGSVFVGFMLFGTDIQAVLRWDLALLVLGLAVLPLSMLVFRSFGLRAYLLSKVIGVATVGYFMWLLSSLRILRFNTISIIVCIAIIACVIYILTFLHLHRSGRAFSSLFAGVEAGNDTKDILAWVIAYEAIFFVVFIVCVWYLSRLIPDGSTERVMDYGFMVMLDKTEYMPPLDMWASGEVLNYYYFGQYLCTFISKLAFVDVSVGYTLSLDMLMCIAITHAFIIVKEGINFNKATKRFTPYLGGLLASVFVALSGNVHYLIYAYIIPFFVKLTGANLEMAEYWFASSTRYIGYVPDDPTDKTISEFPVYSFLIGDLHAHVIDIMIVLTIVAILLAYYIRCMQNRTSECFEQTDRTGNVSTSLYRRIIDDLLKPELIMCAFLICISSMTNFWDYPIYFIVSGSVILFTNIGMHGNRIYTWCITVMQGLMFIGIVMLLNMPFRLKFDAMESGIALCTTHSHPYQLLILWGLPVFTVIMFIIMAIKYRERISCNLFFVLLGLCAIGLVLMPEIIYVRDIYEEGFPRANTMFKLTYQAFMLFGMVCAYGIVRMVGIRNDDSDSVKEYVAKRGMRRTGIVVMILFLLTSTYSIKAAIQWYGPISNWSYQGLDCMSSVKNVMGNDLPALEWVIDNVPTGDVVLTADGDSYSRGCLLSAMSGNPTVLGWNVHEWLWHNSYEYICDRKEDINEIYTGIDMSYKRELINHYDIKYIYVGPKEYEKYPDLASAGLERLGRPVYADNTGENLYYIIEVTDED